MTTQSVVILFTDVVGSTDLLQHLSPEVADETRRNHFSILRQAITESGGTEVKHLGDGLMVAFASASAGLDCAVTMQQEVERDNQRHPYSVGLRVGLSGGEVTREEEDYFGDRVVEAARLCATCDAGQILAAKVVPALAGRWNRHGVRDVGRVTLKGLPDAVPAVEVMWSPLEGPKDHSVPLPARLAIPSSSGVVGRELELTAIGTASKRASHNRRIELVLVSGEAGAGKTTLVAEAAHRAFDGGACVLFGHGEDDLLTPYQLFNDALGHLVTFAPESRLLEHVDVHGSELAGMVPALGSRLPDLPVVRSTDAESERYLRFSAAAGLLSTMSDDAPIVLVLDDLQWADKGSLLLLHHLIATDLPMRLLVLGTYRDSELSYTHDLFDILGRLHRLTGVNRIELAGLDDTGVVELMEAVAGHALDDTGVQLAHAVYRETDGNPFFVMEVLRHLAETGAIYQSESGQWVAGSTLEDTTLPMSVRVVIGSRVGRLGGSASRTLSAAAVIGQDFDLDVLALVTDTPEDELLDALDNAAASALIREHPAVPGRFRFAHALIRRTLYEDLGPTRQSRMHRRVAEALEDLCGQRPGPRVGELARHWFKATQPKDVTKAIAYSRQAADAALAALDPEDALRYYTQAIDLTVQIELRDPVLAIDLAIGLGTAQRQTGDAAYSDTLLDAARRAAELGDTDRLVEATLANDRGYFGVAGSIDDAKVAILEEGLRRLPDDHPDRALLLAHLCSELIYSSSLDHRRVLADEAIAIARKTEDDARIVRVLDHVSRPLHVPQLLDQSLDRSTEALERARRTGDPILLLGAVRRHAYCVACAGDIEELDRCLEASGRLVERLRQPTFTYSQIVELATRAMIAGDIERTEQLATQAFEAALALDDPDGPITYGAQLGIVNWQRGTLGEIVPLMEDAIAQNAGIPALEAGLTAALAESGRVDRALARLDAFASSGYNLPEDHNWLTGMVIYADAATVCRNRTHARSFLDRLAPWAGQVAGNVVTNQGPVSHFLGGLATVLNLYDEASAYFAQSSEFSLRVGARFFGAMTDLWWATMLIQRNGPGDADHARHLLDRALAAAVSNGYDGIQRRAIGVRSELG